MGAWRKPKPFTYAGRAWRKPNNPKEQDMEDIKKVLDDTQEEEVVALTEEVDEISTFAEEEGIELINSLDEDEDISESDDFNEEEKKEKPKQSKEVNAIFAQKRKETQSKAKKAEDKLSLIMKPYGVQSYDEFMKSLDTDITDKKRKELEEEAYDKGYDPEDYIERYESREFIKLQKAKEAARIAKGEQEKLLKEKVQAEMDEFKEEYPQLDINQIMKDPSFSKFLSKYGTLSHSVSEVYNDFLSFTGQKEISSLRKAVSKEDRATGGGRSGAKTVMTKAQAIALREWNGKYPHLKMTAKEFTNNGG